MATGLLLSASCIAQLEVSAAATATNQNQARNLRVIAGEELRALVVGATFKAEGRSGHTTEPFEHRFCRDGSYELLGYRWPLRGKYQIQIDRITADLEGTTRSIEILQDRQGSFYFRKTYAVPSPVLTGRVFIETSSAC